MCDKCKEDREEIAAELRQWTARQKQQEPISAVQDELDRRVLARTPGTPERLVDVFPDGLLIDGSGNVQSGAGITGRGELDPASPKLARPRPKRVKRNFDL